MEQYCIYLRKSRADTEAEARGEGETLIRHEKALLELAGRQSLSITQVYREVVSGETIASRPMMQKLLAEVEKGLWAGVLVMEVERLARGDTIDQGLVAQTFKYSYTKIITPLKIYDPNNEFDEEYFEFGLFMSRREYKTINRRLQRGRLASVKEGKYVANQPPYGYVRKKLEKDKGFILEPHPEQASVVRLIYELYTYGEKQEDGNLKRLGISLIAKRLNGLKIAPQKGEKWVPSSIRDILINPVYIGKLRWNWRPAVKKMVEGQILTERPRSGSDEYVLTDGLHEGIIEPEVFETAKELMQRNPPRPVGDRYTVKNPLCGLVICGKCGRKMIRRPYTNSKYPDTLMCAATECCNISSALHYVEDRVLEALKEWLKGYKLRWENEVLRKENTHNAIKHKALKNLEAELVMLEKQKSNMHDLLERGVYDADTFISRTRSLKERAEEIQNSIESIKFDVQRDESEKLKTVIPKSDNPFEVYKLLSNAAIKNDVLKAFVEKIVYIKEQGSRWHSQPDNFEIVLFPKLPQMRES